VFEGDTLMTFGYVNVGPYVHKLNERSVPADYVELILLCGRYKSGSWKGSELVVDKTIQLERENGKVAVRLEALNKELLAKVYYPMGFKDVPGKYLKAELRPLPPAYGGMWKKSGGGVMDTVGITDDQKEALMKMKEASETYNRQREAQARATPGAPVKAKFPWRDFDDVLDGKLDVDTFGDRVFSRMNSISPDIKRNGKTCPRMTCCWHRHAAKGTAKLAASRRATRSMMHPDPPLGLSFPLWSFTAPMPALLKMSKSS
jgi:hypothetical protein